MTPGAKAISISYAFARNENPKVLIYGKESETLGTRPRNLSLKTLQGFTHSLPPVRTAWETEPESSGWKCPTPARLPRQRPCAVMAVSAHLCQALFHHLRKFKAVLVLRKYDLTSLLWNLLWRDQSYPRRQNPRRPFDHGQKAWGWGGRQARGRPWVWSVCILLNFKHSLHVTAEFPAQRNFIASSVNSYQGSIFNLLPDGFAIQIIIVTYSYTVMNSKMLQSVF